MADICIIDSGIPLGCTTIGGVNRVWLGTYSNDASYTFDADGIATGATSASTVYLMEQDFEYAGLTEPTTYTRENGTVVYEAALTLKFVHLTKEVINLKKKLDKAPIFGVIESNAGETYLAGTDRPGRATEGQNSLGVAMVDLNGATITITFKSASGIVLADPAMIGTDIPVGS